MQRTNTTRMLKKGEHIFTLHSGHIFLVRIIRNNVHSLHGNEVFNVFASELDNAHNIITRYDGKQASDPHGHQIQIMADRPVNIEQEILAHTETYLKDRMVTASENSKLQSSTLSNLFVESNDIADDEIPQSLLHIRQEIKPGPTQPLPLKRIN